MSAPPTGPILTQGAPHVLLFFNRQPVPPRLVSRFYSDPRFEVFATSALTPSSVAFAQRVSAVVVIALRDPLRELAYAVTAGLRKPVVVAMPRRSAADAVDVLAAGAHACVLLPPDEKDLDRLLAIAPLQPADVRFDRQLRLLLDPISRTARYQEQSVRLSPREFALLHHLSQRDGQPVTTMDLYTYIWSDGRSAHHAQRVVAVFVFQLRRKLMRIGLAHAIRTVPGYGYSLMSEMGTSRAQGDTRNVRIAERFEVSHEEAGGQVIQVGQPNAPGPQRRRGRSL